MNIVAQNIYIQDNSSAIAVRFTATQPYNLGDEIEINVKGMELSEFNGLLQINNVPLANFSGTAFNVTPVSVTAIVSQFTSKQLLIRTLADIVP